MIRVAAWTHIGHTRSRNEDAYALPGIVLLGSPPHPVTVDLSSDHSTDEQLIAVVDGMGGHAGGLEADRVVAARAADTHGDVDTWLREVSDDLYDVMERRPELTSMGATIVGLRFFAEEVDIFNVGDARAYLYDGGFASLLSVDDRSTSGGHDLTQSLGGTPSREYPRAHHQVVSLNNSARFLLCSDGLSGPVNNATIQATLEADDPSTAVRNLVEAALAEGGPDNVSVVVVDWVV